MRTLRLALAQINSTVGDLKGNQKKIVHYINRAKDIGADIVAFPELALPGYPPEDLLLKPEFIQDNLACLEELVSQTENITAIIGFVDKDVDIYNSAAVINNHRLAGVYHKLFLPNYGVFDEYRYFQSGNESQIFVHNDVRIGINICEDIWYPSGPTFDQALYGGAEIIINISSSPYFFGKAQNRFRMLCTRAEDNDVMVAYVNLVGGQDELVFDGNSMVISVQGKLICKSPSFKEDLLCVTLYPDEVFKWRLHDPRRRSKKLSIPPDKNISIIKLTASKKHKDFFPGSEIVPFLDANAEVYEALKTGLKDYVQKNGFQNVVIGISGGIDSALVAALATDALGKENVIGVSMPSQYTSFDSINDGRQLAENLGIKFLEIPIKKLFEDFLSQLNPFFKDLPENITEENIQARIRGSILMSLSNKFGWLVLATGNKSEISVGYCTLYGDMVGGFSVIKDVYKGMVYDLVKYRNQLAGKDIIPENILTKAPSAELKPDQKDSDSLPEYEVLDPILMAYVEQDYSAKEIVNQGYDLDTVQKVIELVDNNEYKRRQAAPGIKITYRAFGKDRRFPITNKYNRK
jgi:NAD+ synthase (glutamine-hydrolysing)